MVRRGCEGVADPIYAVNPPRQSLCRKRLLLRLEARCPDDRAPEVEIGALDRANSAGVVPVGKAEDLHAGGNIGCARCRNDRLAESRHDNFGCLAGAKMPYRLAVSTGKRNR